MEIRFISHLTGSYSHGKRRALNLERGRYLAGNRVAQNLKARRQQ